MNDFIKDILNSPDEGPGNRNRVRMSEAELDRRLEVYDASDGFQLTPEHRRVAREIFCNLRNVFLTGGAGTGKTTFINTIVIPELEYRNLNYAVTASTGIAGSHLGGRTLHSWSGIALGPYFPSTLPCPQDMSEEQLYSVYADTYGEWCSTTKLNNKTREGIRRRIRNTEVLLIDEVSMCHGARTLGYLDFFFKRIRDKDDPFGGIQMVFIGDFGQLPPVERRKARSHADWAFLCRAWAEAQVLPLQLTKVFRQEDKVFADFLNNIRVGRPVDPDYVRTFVRVLSHEEALRQSYLVPTNAKADELNAKILQQYPGPTVTSMATFSIHDQLLPEWEKGKHDKIREELVKANLVKRELSLRRGCPVLITYNDKDGRFFNGTRAYVRDFHYRGGGPPDGELEYIVVGIPRRDGEEELVNLGRYTNSRNQKEDPTDVDIVVDEETGMSKTVHAYPVIKQFPVIPASAITIHKGQGMSLDSCVVHVEQTFAPGHVYVALSRLRTAEGLILTSPHFRVEVDPDVMNYYQNLQGAEEEEEVVR